MTSERITFQSDKCSSGTIFVAVNPPEAVSRTSLMASDIEKIPLIPGIC